MSEASDHKSDPQTESEIQLLIQVILDRICALSEAQVKAVTSGELAESERLAEQMRNLLEIHRGLCRKLGDTAVRD